MFSKGRKITFNIEFVYKEVTSDSTIAKDKKKRKVLQRLKRFKKLLMLVFRLNVTVTCYLRRPEDASMSAAHWLVGTWGNRVT